jgi:hypothetical protein
MRFEKIRSIRPLTKLMLKLLQDCHHREKNKLAPPPFYEPDLIKGLHDRGLVEPVKINGTEQFRLTQLGKEYMEHYFGN